MYSTPVRINTPDRILELGIPAEDIDRCDVRFSIPLTKGRQLYIEVSDWGKYIDGIEVIHGSNGSERRETVVSTEGSFFLRFGDNSLDLWNGIRPELVKKTGIGLGREAKTSEKLVSQMHSLLYGLKEQLSGVTYRDIEMEENSWCDHWRVSSMLDFTFSRFPDDPSRLNVNLLELAYANPKLYSSPDMFSPPSERQPHVLRLELTQGCDYNACTYCTGYKGIPYRERSYDEFKRHYVAVKKAIGGSFKRIRRVFLGGGNALNVEQGTLLKVVGHLEREIRPRRISIYGRADSIKGKGRMKLDELRGQGLGLIYWGVESGSQKVLDYVNKRVTLDQMLYAGHVSSVAEIDLSVMVMPGLGGIKHSQSHIDGTVAFLNGVDTRFITFMGINPSQQSRYSKRMKRAVSGGTNRPLTDKEQIEQLRDILEGMRPNGQKVGSFDCTVDQVGHNPVSFNVEFNRSGKKEAIAACNRYLRKH